jgi:DNA transformation protein and related proteins
MFGGFGLRSGETFFGIIMDDTLYFAVDAASRSAYEDLGSKCFSYDSKNRTVESKRYFEVPPDVIEDPAQLVDFARSAVLAAHTHRSKHKPRGRKVADV